MRIATKLDFTEYHRKVEQTKTALRRDLALAVRRACDEGVRVAKRGNFKDRTGQLRATINTTVIGWQGNTFWMQIHAPMPYAHFVDVGTQAHDIYPKRSLYDKSYGPLPKGQSWRSRKSGEHVVGRGIALRWNDDGGNEHFARMVHHPGSRATNFFADAIDATRMRLAIQLMNGDFANLRSVWA
jgi:hypothetical protein